MAPSPPESPWLEAFAAVATYAAARPAASRLTSARVGFCAAEPPHLSLLETWRRHHPSSAKPGTPPTPGADSHGPHFLNSSRCITVAKKAGGVHCATARWHDNWCGSWYGVRIRRDTLGR